MQSGSSDAVVYKCEGGFTIQEWGWVCTGWVDWYILILQWWVRSASCSKSWYQWFLLLGRIDRSFLCYFKWHIILLYGHYFYLVYAHFRSNSGCWFLNPLQRRKSWSTHIIPQIHYRFCLPRYRSLAPIASNKYATWILKNLKRITKSSKLPAEQRMLSQYKRNTKETNSVSLSRRQACQV